MVTIGGPNYLNFATSVPDPVGSGSFWLDPDPDVWDRILIRILALINYPISTFLVFVKAIKTFKYLCC
jgi:hypothetical protein